MSKNDQNHQKRHFCSLRIFDNFWNTLLEKLGYFCTLLFGLNTLFWPKFRSAYCEYGHFTDILDLLYYVYHPNWTFYTKRSMLDLLVWQNIGQYGPIFSQIGPFAQWLSCTGWTFLCNKRLVNGQWYAQRSTLDIFVPPNIGQYGPFSNRLGLWYNAYQIEHFMLKVQRLTFLCAKNG